MKIDLRKKAKNADEDKQIDDVIEELRKVTEEAGDYSARFAKKISKDQMVFHQKSKIMNQKFKSSIMKLEFW